MTETNSELSTPEDFYEKCLSVTITSLKEGAPWCSYAPFVSDEKNRIYVLISEMAAHTKNLLADERACLFLIEDEATANQIFARRRLTLNATAFDVDKQESAAVIGKFKNKFGAAYNNLHELADFHLIQFTPTSGSLVLGFGMAYGVSYDEGIFEMTGRRGGGHKSPK